MADKLTGKKGFLVQVGSMAEDGKFTVEKFNSQNFSLWKMQMEYYMYQKDLYLPLSGKTKKPAAMTNEEWDILDKRHSEQYGCASRRR